MLIFIKEDLELSIAKKHLHICSSFYHCSKRFFVETSARIISVQIQETSLCALLANITSLTVRKGQQHLLLTMSGLLETCLY